MEILSVDSKMKELLQLAQTIAPSKATVLIQGESGTGKELIAQLIHQKSNRSQKSFVAINCAAIPENLLESELFGYEKGSFTGAHMSKSGKFELAHGGTLLLDEISEMDIRLQAKLLRVVQEGEVDRIGSNKPISVDVRLLATTNRNLSEAIREGLFREDLFYRLNVVNLKLPALRERMGDIELLSHFFVKHYSQINGKKELLISSGARDELQNYFWPGNIRELQHMMERAVLICSGQNIEKEHLKLDKVRLIQTADPQSFQEVGSSASSLDKQWSPGRTLDDVERNVIIEALSHHGGNRTHTAKSLGISIRTLRNKIADYKKIGIFV